MCTNRTLTGAIGTVMAASSVALQSRANGDSGHDRPDYICLNRGRKSNVQGVNGSHSI